MLNKFIGFQTAKGLWKLRPGLYITVISSQHMCSNFRQWKIGLQVINQNLLCRRKVCASLQAEFAHKLDYKSCSILRSTLRLPLLSLLSTSTALKELILDFLGHYVTFTLQLPGLAAKCWGNFTSLRAFQPHLPHLQTKITLLSS